MALIDKVEFTAKNLTSNMDGVIRLLPNENTDDVK